MTKQSDIKGSAFLFMITQSLFFLPDTCWLVQLWLCTNTLELYDFNVSHTTSKRKAQKLVCHSQFCERSSPALLPNCGQIMKKQQLFIFPNSLTIHQTSILHNTFYFNNTWTKIQLRSDPVNMQPDKTKCYPQRPITTYGLLPARCWVHEAKAPLRTVGHYHHI